jgi:signal transduction histidine kinase
MGQTDNAITKHGIGLRARFLIVSTSILLIIFAVIAIYLVSNAQNTDIRNINQSSKAFAAFAAQPLGDSYSIYQNSASIQVQKQMQSFVSLDSNVSNIGIVSLTGQILLRYSNAQFLPITDPATFSPIYSKSSGGFIQQIVTPYISADGQHPYGVVILVSDHQLLQEIQSHIINIGILSLIGLVITAVILYNLLNYLFISPVERISRQALKISKGDYDQVIQVSSNDEIGDLASSVNTMRNSLSEDITKLQELDKLKNEFIAIASHNLRTPLSIIQGNVELVNDSSLPPEVYTAITAIKDSANHLNAFAEDMLTISMIESGKVVLEQKTVSLNSLVEKYRQSFEEQAKNKDITLKWDIAEPDAMVRISPTFISGVIRNLLDNAIKFTDKGGKVTCQIQKVADKLIVRVQDTGIGIANEEKDKLFTKFHRGTSFMVYNYKGTGIGLYVAKLIVDAHNGNITVDTEPGKGSTFTVIVPQ